MEHRTIDVINNSALLIKTRLPASITSVVPHSQLLGPVPGTDAFNVLVNWTLDSARILRNIGFKQTPSPIRAHYTWPGRFKPFKHQLTTAEFLSLHKRAFCLNQQGLGKSASCIWAADYLMEQKLVKRVLVIAPLSILYTAWMDEIFNTAIHRSVGVAYGTRDERKAIISGNSEFVIINHDGIKLVAADIIAANFDLIVVDEHTGFKNCTTARWKTLNTFIRPDTWVWLLSGTPVPQSPLDAYGPIKLIQPSNVPKYFNGWRELVTRKITTFKWAIRPEARDIIHNAMQPAIRFEKKDCLDLPPVTYEMRNVDLTPQQQHYYKAMKTSARLTLQGGQTQVNAVNAAAMLTKLMQIAAGAVWGDDDKVVQFDISSRLNAIKEIIDDSDAKVLIAVPYVQALLRLAEELGKDYTLDVIYGDVPAGKRADIIRKFQNESEPRLLILQPAATAHGITLTEADTIIWYSPTTSFEVYSQFNARIDRPGQKRAMTVFQLQGCDAEKKLNAALRVMGQQHIDLMELYNEVLV